MILKLVWFIILLAFIQACAPKDDMEAPPAYILSEDSLIIILTDCYLGEGAAGINIKGVSGEKLDSAYAFNPIIENGVTRARFDSSLVYYSAHPKTLKLIYDKVLQQLSEIQANGKLKK